MATSEQCVKMKILCFIRKNQIFWVLEEAEVICNAIQGQGHRENTATDKTEESHEREREERKDGKRRETKE